MRARNAVVTAGFMGTLLALAGNAVAASGDLDPTFGNDGRVSFAMGSRHVQASSAIQQADGRIVVAGGIDGYDFLGSSQLLLVRLEPDGTVDTSFGHSGNVIGAKPGEWAAALVQQGDGKLVVAGRNSNTDNIELWRFSGNGMPDVSFGTGGTVTLDLGKSDYASGLVQQADGKFVIAGTTSGGGGTSDTDLVMARFNADGTLDKTFGSAGTNRFSFAHGASEFAYALVQQRDGKLVMTGNRSVAVHNSRGGTVAVVRTTADGALDKTFSDDGIQEIFLDYQSMEGSFVTTWAQSAALSDGGKIIVNGMVGADGDFSGFVFRLEPGGALDLTFGTNGIVFHRQVASAAVAIQSDGKIVTAGSEVILRTDSQGIVGEDMTLTRINSDGSTDTTFGANGTSIADFVDESPFISPRAMVRQIDGRFVVVGNGDHSLVIARFGAGETQHAGLIGFNSVTYNMSESDKSVVFAVRRTGGSTGAVSVNFATAADTAQPSSDFENAPGTLYWNDGDSSNKNLTVNIINDTLDEATRENFTVTLSAPTGGAQLAASQTLATIIDDDGPGEIELDQSTLKVYEDSGVVQVLVNRIGGSTGAVSMSYSATSGTATVGTDFEATLGTLSWADGDSAIKTITVNITNDSVEENDEIFTVTLSNPVGGTALVSNSTATVTILNDDAPSGGESGSGGGGGGGALDGLTLSGLLGALAIGMRRRRS